MTNKILRINDVIDLTGLGKSTIYKYIKEGDFPKQVKLTERSVGWYEQDIVNWINSRVTSEVTA